ncbi:MAG: hypothetical protein U1F43_16280 [Myxococcota bacterium]
MADAPVTAPPTTTTTPTTKKSETTPSGQPTTNDKIKSGLRGLSYDDQEKMLVPPGGPSDPKGGPPAAPNGDFQTQLGIWMPAVVKVTDPVAFMTSADAKGQKGKGSYAQAIGDKGSKGGFYELAKAELARIQAEVAAYCGAKADLEAGQRDELARLGEMLGGYRDLYAAIQGTAMSEEGAKDPKKRAAVAARVQAVVGATRGKLTGLNPEVLGLAALQKIAASFDEVALFVDAWSDTGGDQSNTSASPYMWATFLQTVERYRSILNQYGELEARGGDATGTSKMAVKGGSKPGGMAQSKEDFDAAAAKKGGTMALALESYSMKAEAVAAYQKQVAEMQERVRKGEFATQEEAVAAFRKHVGGGAASEAFYAQLEELAKATFSASKGDQFIAQETKQLTQAKNDYTSADKSADASKLQGQASYTAYGEHKKQAEDMNKPKADAAWEACQSHREKALAMLSQSQAMLASGDQHRTQALELHSQAMAELASAKLCLKNVDTKRFASLLPGVQSVEGQIAAAETKLATNAETQKQLESYKQKIAAKVALLEQAKDAFDPKKMEVAAPSAEVDGMKGELEHYKAFEVKLSGKVSPIIELFGSAAGKGGTKLDGDELWSFAEGEWSAGIKVDLWLFELSVAYIGAITYEVKGDEDVMDVIERGDKERSRWEASKEVGQKQYDKKLKKAFDMALSNGLVAYDPLAAKAKKVSGGDKRARKEFNDELEPAATKVETAQNMLEEYAAGIFYDVDGFIEYIKTKIIIRDGDELGADIRALRDVPNEQLAQETDASKRRFTGDNRKTDALLQDRFSQATDSTNDPNVKFEASGSWEVGASAGIGGAEASIKARASTTVSDGEDEKFDYKEEESTTVSAEVEFGSSSVGVEAVFKEDERKFGVGGKLGFKLAGKEEEEEVTKHAVSKGKVLWRALGGQDGGAEMATALKDWYQELVGEIEEKVKKPEVELGAKHQVDLDFGFEQKYDEASKSWYWASGEFGIGFATVIEGGADMGVVSVEASYTSGMKATFKLFEHEAPSKEKGLEKKAEGETGPKKIASAAAE